MHWRTLILMGERLARRRAWFFNSISLTTDGGNRLTLLDLNSEVAVADIRTLPFGNRIGFNSLVELGLSAIFIKMSSLNLFKTNRFFIKFYIKTLSLCTVLIVHGCADSPETVQTMEPVTATTEASGLYGRDSTGQMTLLKAYAEPVAPTTIKAFPHLSGFEGHILIGNQKTQLVVSGVSSEAVAGPKVIRAYKFINENWKELDLFDSLELSVGSRTSPFNPVAVDAKVDPDTETATVTFRLKAPKKDRYVNLTIRTSAQYSQIGFIFNQNTGWQVAAKGIAGRTLPSQSKTSDYVASFRNQSLMVIQGHTPLKVKTINGEWIASPAKFLPALNGFHLLIGEDAMQRVLLEVSANEECQTAVAADIDKSQDPAARMQQFTECLRRKEGTHLQFTLPEEEAPLANIPRRLVLKSKTDEAIAYGSSIPGSVASFQLAKTSEAVSMQEIPSGATWNDDFSFPLAGRSVHTVQLTARHFHDITIKGDGFKPKAAVLVHVESKVDQEGFNPSSEIRTISDLIMLSKTNLLAAEWPIRLGLASGMYQIDIFRAHQGKICSLSVEIGAAKPTQPLHCSSKLPAKPQDKNRYASLDLASLVLSDYVKALHLALAIDGMASPPTKRKLLEEDDEAIRLIPQLSASNPESMLTMTLYPVDETLLENWSSFENSSDLPTLQKFAEFAHRFAPNSVLELSCPRANLSTGEYLRVVDKTKPTALQLFGCRLLASKIEARKVFQHIGKFDEFPQITSVSGLSSRWKSFHFPRIVMPRNQFVATGELHRSLREGRYTLAQGATLALGSWAYAENQRKLSLEFSLTANRGVDVSEIKLYLDSGKEFTKPVKKADGKSVEWAVQVEPETRWYRIEVLGATRSSGNSALRTVAMSNLIPLR